MWFPGRQLLSARSLAALAAGERRALDDPLSQRQGITVREITRRNLALGSKVTSH